MSIHYIISIILAIVLGQMVKHLNKKMPDVVSEKITYNEFFKSLKKDFKIDIKYSIILSLIAFFLTYKCVELGKIQSIYIYTYTIISAALMIVFSIDFRFQLIPDEVHIVIALCGLIHIILNCNNWYSYLLGALIGGGTFYLIGLLSLLILRKEGMGFGDVKLMTSLGFAFGIKNIIVIILTSFVIGAIIGGTLLILKKKDSNGYIAFGPFIVVGVILIMFVPSGYILEIYIAFCSWLGMKMTDGIYYFLNR